MWQLLQLQIIDSAPLREKEKKQKKRKRKKKQLAFLPEDDSLSVPIKSCSCPFSANIAEIWKAFNLKRLRVDKIELLRSIFQNLITRCAISVINIIHVH